MPSPTSRRRMRQKWGRGLGNALVAVEDSCTRKPEVGALSDAAVERRPWPTNTGESELLETRELP
jgi:hypothetical protein